MVELSLAEMSSFVWRRNLNRWGQNHINPDDHHHHKVNKLVLAWIVVAWRTNRSSSSSLSPLLLYRYSSAESSSSYEWPCLSCLIHQPKASHVLVLYESMGIDLRLAMMGWWWCEFHPNHQLKYTLVYQFQPNRTKKAYCDQTSRSLLKIKWYNIVLVLTLLHSTLLRYGRFCNKM